MPYSFQLATLLSVWALAASAQPAPESPNGSASGAPAITGSMYNGNNTRPLITVPQSDGSTAVASNNRDMTQSGANSGAGATGHGSGGSSNGGTTGGGEH